MINRRTTSILLLLTASLIWGTSFVAQILGMEHIGPMTFCFSRYIVSFLILLPFSLIIDGRRSHLRGGGAEGILSQWKNCISSGVICGTALFTASSLQQVGLLYTSAGKAAFITAMYIVIVPLYGLFMKKIPSRLTICAILLSTAGLYLLSVKSGFTMEAGDALIFASAFFWAAHIMACYRFSKSHDPLKLSAVQFATVALLSAAAMFLFESPRWGDIYSSLLPILYAGFFCTCVAYTLQMMAQRYVSPVATCIILSAEALFAAFFGCLILGETLTARELIGCAVLFSATLLAQVEEVRNGG